MPRSGPSVTRRPSGRDVGALRAVEQVLFDWLRVAGSTEFRDVQQLLMEST